MKISLDKLSAGSVLSAAGSLYSGISALQSSGEQASLLQAEGALTQADYFRQAALIRDEGYRTRAKQAMQFIGAGVEIVGTPLLVLRETMSRSGAEARSYETAGIAKRNLANRQADITRREGQAALVSSILTAGGALLDA